MVEQYSYAVSRVRAKEANLLNSRDFDALTSAKSYNEAISYLIDKGFGDGSNDKSYIELLETEREQMWNFIREIMDDLTPFDVLLYKNDFHNLKAAIKMQITGEWYDDLFSNNGTVSPAIIKQAVESGNWSDLPNHLEEVGKKANDVLLKTGDGQECDILIDRAALETILIEGKKSELNLINEYTELETALADIKIAYRAVKMGKNQTFIKRALAQCDTIDISALASAAGKGEEELLGYLKFTPYSESIAALEISISEFEKWSDNKLLDLAVSQRTNPFTAAPIIAYMLAVENQIKIVRIILSAKQNETEESMIRERLRNSYV